jgi:hypothetical protein
MERATMKNGSRISPVSIAAIAAASLLMGLTGYNAVSSLVQKHEATVQIKNAQLMPDYVGPHVQVAPHVQVVPYVQPVPYVRTSATPKSTGKR